MEVQNSKEVLTLEEIKNYLRIDYDDDDTMLLGLISAATSYLESGVDNFQTSFTNNPYFRERAKLIARVLIVDWYDNREVNKTKTKDDVRDGIPYTVRSLMTQLQAGAE